MRQVIQKFTGSSKGRDIGVLGHYAQERAAIFGGYHVENVILIDA